MKFLISMKRLTFLKCTGKPYEKRQYGERSPLPNLPSNGFLSKPILSVICVRSILDRGWGCKYNVMEDIHYVV